MAVTKVKKATKKIEEKYTSLNEIEHILIEVYNYHISSANSQIKSLNLVGFQEQVSDHFIHNRY